MTTRFVVLAALLATACGGLTTPGAPTAVAVSTQTAAETPATSSARDAGNSCPSDPPRNLRWETHDDAVRLSFDSEVDGAWVYEARIVRRGTGELGTPQNDQGRLWIEWRPSNDDGTYDAVVARKACGRLGQSSSEVTFSFGSPAPEPEPPASDPLDPEHLLACAPHNHPNGEFLFLDDAGIPKAFPTHTTTIRVTTDGQVHVWLHIRGVWVDMGDSVGRDTYYRGLVGPIDAARFAGFAFEACAHAEQP